MRARGRALRGDLQGWAQRSSPRGHPGPPDALRSVSVEGASCIMFGRMVANCGMKSRHGALIRSPIKQMVLCFLALHAQQ